MRPERVVADLLHADVVQLEEIDAIGLQPLQRGIGRARDRFRREILRNLALAAAAAFAMRDEIVADLRRDHDFVALLRERLRDQLFAEAVAVSIGGIEERDAEIERLVHERDRFAFGELAPPAGRNGPEAEADFADVQVGVFVGAEAHIEKKRSTSNVERSTSKRQKRRSADL